MSQVFRNGLFITLDYATAKLRSQELVWDRYSEIFFISSAGNAFTQYGPGCHVVGFDASASSLKLMKYRADLLGIDPDRFQMDLADMLIYPFGQDEFDVILANQCLQYCFDEAIPKLKEIAGNIKPGGWFIYSGNIPPHKATEKPIRFIMPEDIREYLKDWEFLSFGTDEILIRQDDFRGFADIHTASIDRKANGKVHLQAFF